MVTSELSYAEKPCEEAALTTNRTDLPRRTEEEGSKATPSFGSRLDPTKPLAATTSHILKSKKSLWDVFSGTQSSSDGEGVAGAPCVDKSNSVQDRRSDDGWNDVSLSNRRSFASFPGMSWVPRSSKRHTLASETFLAAQHCGERAEQGNERDELQKGAKDTLAFPAAAQFAGIIAVDGDVENIRRLAIDMELAWRTALHKVTEMKEKLADKALRLHDLKDENDHLRVQLGNLSEQIVEREATLEELQHRFVVQNMKEKEQWESERAQILADCEARIANMTRAMVGHSSTTRQRRDEADSSGEASESEPEDESDGESDLDSILFSANTSVNSSIDGELQRQQLSVSKLPFSTLDISPTTPKIRTACR